MLKNEKKIINCLFLQQHDVHENRFIFYFSPNCRNPTLVKCGGEAQHLEKLEVWSPPRLPNV